MKLKEHYKKLWEQSLQKFREQEFEIDPLIDSKNDTRYGITLLARPTEEIKQEISKMLDEIKAFAPNQYYYPISDLHITILSIMSCCEGFSLDKVDQTEYQKLVHSAIESISPFNIQFSGLTASPSSILVQGFPKNKQLETLRNSLRQKFEQSDLQHSIDKRYQLKTAHMTVIRFKEPLSEPRKFIKAIAEYRDKKIGSCVIDQMELVGNDWYQQNEKVKLIDKFKLFKRDFKIS